MRILSVALQVVVICVRMRALVLAAAAATAIAVDSACFALLPESTKRTLQPAPVQCSAVSTRSKELCFLMCGLCTTPALAIGVDDGTFATYCQQGSTLPSDSAIINVAVSTLINVTMQQGTFFIENNVTDAYALIVSGMPRRDMLVLFSEPYMFLDYMEEHIRLGLNAIEAAPWAAAIDPALMLQYVVPYGFLDEKRDFFWRWRPRFYQLLQPLITAANATTITQAMHVLSDAIPAMSTLGLLSFFSGTQGLQLEPGQPITWRSETSPGYLSPSQVAYRGGSCTGTAIVMAAAARAVGIPARIAGCSESVVRGDDHHWIEFYDPTAPGPFGTGDYWHTKEGTSAGNTGGPWDSPSGPMLGCLQGVVPGSTVDTLWASNWLGGSYLPMLWSNDTWSQAWAFVGGENRCGEYCSAWGCGVNNTQKWSQAQCGPAA